ncbi:OmcA/MtrC family decaheme c-type cytochrome [bacterium]|nr:OmcA/MtrC family decaheme c-type cytochrome [bacterium]
MSRKKLITLLAVLTLAAPLMFYGCEGDDGARGPAGDNGATGPPGTGVAAEETCVLCHGAGKTENVTDVHRIDQTAGSMTVEIQSVAFGTPDVDNNVDVTVNFTFAAEDSAGNDITSLIDLTTPAANTTALPNNSTDNLAYIRFSLAQLTSGQNGSPDEWGGFVVSPGAPGSGPFSTANRDGVNGAAFNYAAGVGSYTFRDNVIKTPDFKDNLVTRAFVQVSGVPITLFTSDPYFNLESRRRPVANAVKDVVSAVGTTQTAAPGAGFPVKNDVSTQACNTCHDPLVMHSAGRREYKACQVCHNAKLETLETLKRDGSIVPNDNLNLVNLIHKYHNSAGGDRFTGVQDIGAFAPPEPIGFPQAINNCRTCHQGPAAADNTYDNFMNRPSRVACGSCHFQVDFVTGGTAGTPSFHQGGPRADDSGCVGCHSDTAILGYHAAKEGAPTTPNNPTIAAGLKDVRYSITSATVDNTNAATVKFAILIDGGLANLGDNVITRPTDFSGGPSFLLAYTLPQDGVNAPADYNNLGRTAGQPRSVSIVGLPIVASDNASYTVKVDDAFPAGAKMRAVALQGYFTQTAAIGTDNVARHTPSVQVAVTGDAVRRTVVKSGYNATTGAPEGCLECHEVFEGHGGNRVNNVQVCVMCHNPNLTTSGRTLPDNAALPAALVAAYGSDPLQYPEVTNNFKSMIHGIHSSEMRVNPFIDIRNALPRAISFFDFSEVTYPGDVSHCTKCHVGTTYQDVLVPNALLTTEKITTGVAGETLADIKAARASVPNSTDLVDSPTASACGYCHDSTIAVSHFRTMGGDVKATRSDALVAPPPLMPDVSP